MKQGHAKNLVQREETRWQQMETTPLKNCEARLRWRDSQTSGYLASKLLLGTLRDNDSARWCRVYVQPFA